ncbi:MAG: TIGR03564 family F420-dependent LLM class oxidoreductase [Nocardioides sp.]|nr:TIGR03564 family F420-dependent LLM class oxidoreductase [Nocardioides sp.]
MLSVAGTRTATVELGVAVVPIQRQHPVELAQRAFTASALTAGRFVLGVGVTHQHASPRWGMTYDRPVDHMEEYLRVLHALFTAREVDYQGDRIGAHLRLDIPGDVPEPTLLLAALGPRVLGLAGTWAHGTVLWLVGPQALEQRIMPTIAQAAEDAGRPSPRMVVSLPICLTDDKGSARSIGSDLYDTTYGAAPSYARALAWEGLSRPSELALIGSENELERHLDRLADIGATDFYARVFGTPHEVVRTREFLVARARSREG